MAALAAVRSSLRRPTWTRFLSELHHLRRLPLSYLSSQRCSSWTCPPTRAAVYHEHGAPDEVVRLVDIPGTCLQQQEVCVKMLAAPINPSDINRIEGFYPVRSPLPAVGGHEGVGVVIATADDVETLSVNDWVIPAIEGVGTWHTHVVKKESAWCKVRNDVPMEYAATISVNPCTALRMLQDFVQLQAGDMVVQNGATSMVGQCVIQLASLQNLQTVNIVRERPDLQEVKDRLKVLGAVEVFSESDPALKGWLGRERDSKLGLNCVGGSAATMVMKLLGDGGTMVTYGGMAKKPITVSTSSMIFKNIRLQGFWLQEWIRRHTHEEFAAMTDYLLGLVNAGRLNYLVEKVPFSRFNLALDRAMGKHGSVSKQLLVFD